MRRELQVSNGFQSFHAVYSRKVYPRCNNGHEHKIGPFVLS